MPNKPTSLKPGDTIGVFAPSSWVEKYEIEKSQRTLEQLGFKVFIHPQTYEREKQSAGNTLQKSLAFQGLWMRKDIDAIWAAGGGNRCLHFIESINFKKLTSHPKPVIGFSDVTSLLNALYAECNIPTVHGPVFKNLHKYKQIDHLLDVLVGKETKYPVCNANIIRHGQAEGHLIGGNLSLFQYLPQTLPNEFYNDGILFIEDCNEELSRIDRMLLHLKRTGTLSKIKGLLIGQFTNMNESGKPFGYTLDELIEEHCEGLDIPILKDLPFGHGKDLYSLPIGIKIKVDTQEPSLQLSESFSI